MKKWTFVMLLIALVLFGSVIGFNLFKQKMIADYLANRPEASNPVTVEEVQLQTWTPTIEAIGFIEPAQGVLLTTQSAGIIDSIQFESGEQVEAGKTLIVLDSAVEKANLKSAQARLPAAKAKFERYKGLYRKGSISRESFDDAQAAYLSLSADIDSLKASIAKRTIQAPFSGIVGIRNVYLGQYLKSGTEIVQLEDISHMRFHFSVPQTDISRLKIGQEINIAVDAYPDKTFSGIVKAIAPTVSAQTGLLQIEADIPNSDGLLRSGMFARADVLLPTLTEQIAIPQTAITYTLYGDSVYVINEKDGDKRVEQKVVKIGERKGSVAHVIEGLNDGDVIVTSGQVRLSNGAKVHIVESDATKIKAEIPML